MGKRFLVISLVMALVIVVGPAAVMGQSTGEVIGEAGEVIFNDPDTGFDYLWQKIFFNNTYASAPVVIATVVTANQGDDNSLIPVINGVTPTYFYLNICKDAGEATCGATPAQETVHYFVFDVDKANDYAWIDVGKKLVTTDGLDTTLTYST